MNKAGILDRVLAFAVSYMPPPDSLLSPTLIQVLIISEKDLHCTGSWDGWSKLNDVHM